MRASWWTALQAIIGMPVSVAVNLVVARTLGPHGYGLIATYMAAYVVILAVLNAGISDATIQWGAAAYARGDRRELLELCRKCAGFHLLVEAPLGAIAAVVLLHNESVGTQLTAAAAIAVTMSLGTTVVVLTAISMNAVLAKLNLAVGLAVQLAVVTAAVQSHAAGPTWVARIALSVLAPIGAVLLAPRDIRRAALTPSLPRAWPAGFAKYSIRTLVGGLVASLVFSRCEIFVLDAYGDTAAAGLFALAAGLAVQITAPIDAMLGPLIPAAASLLAVSRERAAAAVLRGIRLSVLATAPIAVVAVPALAVLAPAIYGDRFTLTGQLFVSLGIVSCLQSVLHPVTAFVAALRKPLLVLAINGGALALDLALVAALVPVIGAAGAVVGNSVGQVTSLLASTYIMRKYLGLSLRATLSALLPFIVLIACAAIVSGAGLAAVDHGVNVVIATIAAVSVATIAGFLAVRSAGGAVTADDLRAVESGFPRAIRPVARVISYLGLAGRPSPADQSVSAGPVRDQ